MATNDDVHSQPKDSKIFKCDKHAVDILENIQALYNNEKQFPFDIILVADGTKVKAHRFVLQIKNRFFQEKLRADTFPEGSVTEIEIEEIEGDILSLIVEFLYTGSIELSPDTVDKIKKAAKHLQLPTLILACKEFLDHQLDVSNCIGFALMAHQQALTVKYKKFLHFVCQNLEEVCKEEEFLKMNSAQLIDMLASDDASVASEEVVFRSVMAWINHDKANREDQMSDLLSVIRFSLLTPKFISDNIIPVCKTDDSQKLILKWLQWHHSPDCRADFPDSFHVRPRRLHMKAFVLSGNSTFSWKMQTFDREANVWSSQDLPESLGERSNFGAILKNGKLIITGGRSSGQVLNTVDCLDMVTSEWTTLPNMREARYDHAMAELGGNLYVIGGATRKVPSGVINFTMEMYDFITLEWTDLAPIPLKNAKNLQSTVSNGKLYICSDANVLCYDPAQNKWTRCLKTYCCRENGFIAVGEYLYLVGGGYRWDNGYRSERLCRFDPLTGKSENTSLKFKRCSPACYALNGRFLVCGGAEESVEEYDPVTNESTVMADMKHKNDIYVRNSL